MSGLLRQSAPTWRDALGAAVRGRVQLDAHLAERTTFRVGGPADVLFEPADAEDLSRALAVARDRGVPVTVLGGGSNVLVADAGVRGLVVHPGRGGAPTAGETGPDGRVPVIFDAGLATAAVRKWAARHGLVGTEFLAGIPGSLGGALRMNAGTRLGDMAGVVTAAEVATADGAGWHAAAAFGLAYRHAVVPGDGVVTRVTLALTPADPETVAAAEEAARAELARRHATQPRGRSAGSMFKNPPGDFAGRLIEACGLKGARRGGAQVSEVHANFIVNADHATAADILGLARRCREAVRERFEVTLQYEVKRLGEFDDARS